MYTCIENIIHNVSKIKIYFMIFLLIYMNIPLLISTFVIMFLNTPVSAFLFLGLIGVSNGLANVLGSSTWAEIYGVRFLGSIKALTTAFMVFSTAFGTAIFGIFIDNGFTVEFISLVSIGYISLSLFALIVIKRHVGPIIITKKT